MRQVSPKSCDNTGDIARGKWNADDEKQCVADNQDECGLGQMAKEPAALFP